MAFLRTFTTPAGVQAVHEVGLAGADLGEVGQAEDLLASLPDLIRAGGDVASQVYRAVNYTPTQYPTTYTSPYASGGPGLFTGISPTTILLLGGGLLVLLMMRR